MERIKQLINIFWNGKWRIRAQGKRKFFNRVEWWLEEGKTPTEIRELLYNEKISALRTRADQEGLHGRKRSNFLGRKKYQIREALRVVLGNKVYKSEFPNSTKRYV